MWSTGGGKNNDNQRHNQQPIVTNWPAARGLPLFSLPAFFPAEIKTLGRGDDPAHTPRPPMGEEGGMRRPIGQHGLGCGGPVGGRALAAPRGTPGEGFLNYGGPGALEKKNTSGNVRFDRLSLGLYGDRVKKKKKKKKKPKINKGRGGAVLG